MQALTLCDGAVLPVLHPLELQQPARKQREHERDAKHTDAQAADRVTAAERCLAQRWVATPCGRRPRARLTRPHAPPHGARPAVITLAGAAAVAGPVGCAIARRLDQTIREIPALLTAAARRALPTRQALPTRRALPAKRGKLAKPGMWTRKAAAPAAGLRPSGPGASGPRGVRRFTARALAWAAAGSAAPLSATGSLVVSARQLPVPPRGVGIAP